MKNRLLLFLSAIFLIVVASSCGKKGLKLTGKENENEMFHHCLSLSKKKEFQELIDCLEIFKSRFPNSEFARTAEVKVADTYFDRKEYLLAAETYKIYVSSHPSSQDLDYAYYKIGLSYFNQAPSKIDRDQKYLVEAANYLATLIEQFPQSSYLSEAQNLYQNARTRLAKRHFYVGRFYYRQKEYLAAISRFEEVTQRFSGLGLDEEAYAYLIRSWQRLEKPEQARAGLQKMRENFPENPQVRKFEAELQQSHQSPDGSQ